MWTMNAISESLPTIASGRSQDASTLPPATHRPSSTSAPPTLNSENSRPGGCLPWLRPISTRTACTSPASVAKAASRPAPATVIPAASSRRPRVSPFQHRSRPPTSRPSSTSGRREGWPQVYSSWSSTRIARSGRPSKTTWPQIDHGLGAAVPQLDRGQQLVPEQYQQAAADQVVAPLRPVGGAGLRYEGHGQGDAEDDEEQRGGELGQDVDRHLAPVGEVGIGHQPVGAMGNDHQAHGQAA